MEGSGKMPEEQFQPETERERRIFEKAKQAVEKREEAERKARENHAWESATKSLREDEELLAQYLDFASKEPLVPAQEIHALLNRADAEHFWENILQDQKIKKMFKEHPDFIEFLKRGMQRIADEKKISDEPLVKKHLKSIEEKFQQIDLEAEPLEKDPQEVLGEKIEILKDLYDTLRDAGIPSEELTPNFLL